MSTTSIVVIQLIMIFIQIHFIIRTIMVHLVFKRKLFEVGNVLRPLDQGGQLTCSSKFELCL